MSVWVHLYVCVFMSLLSKVYVLHVFLCMCVGICACFWLCVCVSELLRVCVSMCLCVSMKSGARLCSMPQSHWTIQTPTHTQTHTYSHTRMRIYPHTNQEHTGICKLTDSRLLRLSSRVYLYDFNPVQIQLKNKSRCARDR